MASTSAGWSQHTEPSALQGTPLARHVAAGLRQHQKRLSSLYFYDDEGSRLFAEIMALPEYYLTRCEREILQQRGAEIAAWMLQSRRAIDVVELGSGNGSKTVELVVALRRSSASVSYYPLDVSEEALETLKRLFSSAVPDVQVLPTPGDYFEVWPRTRSDVRSVALFLGSNIGNLSNERAVSLLRSLRARLRPGDGFLLGVDLKKDPHTVLAAYNDARGVTARFNLNLLVRLNRELKMDFDVRSFRHYATYSPLDGVARSFLVSQREQLVTSRVLEQAFHFAEGEALYTEQSQKYDPADLERLAQASGFAADTSFRDARGWYEVAAWRAV